MTFAEPYFKRFCTKSHSLRKQVHRIVEGTQELTDLGFDMPKYARRLLGQLDRGEISVIAHHEGFEEAMKELQKASSRVSMSILTAALIIGLGLLMLIYHPPGWEKYGGWFFGLLFAAVVFVGLGLLWKIWRSGRER
jgi:ubiquinone biosynthesis protein